jgi:hypothetical protein
MRAADSTHASLVIETGADTALVFIDSMRAGFTPLSATTTPGRHILRLVHIDVSSWLTGTMSDTLVLAPGEDRRLHYEFERRFMIVTSPAGAQVRVGDSLAGTTPLLVLFPPGGVLPRLALQKTGYETVPVTIPPGQGGIVRATLTGLWQAEAMETPFLNDSPARNPLRFYIAGGATLLSGISAAYFKIRADEQHEMFLQTADPARRDDTRRLDSVAAISLVLTQVGFAFLTYFLLSD